MTCSGNCKDCKANRLCPRPGSIIGTTDPNATLAKLLEGNTIVPSMVPTAVGEPVDARLEFAKASDDDVSVVEVMKRYGLSEAEARVSVDRQKVYGDPYTNHHGIAQAITGLLQPWALRIARMEPLPPHVVALILCAVKLSRQRMRHHQDNYVDMQVYQAFASVWQREWEAGNGEPPTVIPPKPHPNAVLEFRWVTPPATSAPTPPTSHRVDVTG